MLPKRFRLTKSEFKAVRDHGQFLSGKLLAILILRPSDYPTSDLRHPKAGLPADQRTVSRERIVHEVGERQAKAGLIVSLRLSPKAVVRNLLKRRLRAALIRVLPDIKSNLHLVVLPNRRALTATVSELETEIKNLVIGSLKID